MIYEGRLVNVIRGMEKEWTERIYRQFFPMLSKHGAKPIGAYQSVIGNTQDYYVVIQFASLAQREQVFADMAGDPEWQKIDAAWAQLTTVSNIYITMIKPVAPPK